MTRKPTQTKLRSITRTLRRLNYDHGEGFVDAIRLDDTGLAGTMYRRIPCGRGRVILDTRRFRLSGNSVIAFGTSLVRRMSPVELRKR